MNQKNLPPVLLIEDSLDDIEFARRALSKCDAPHRLVIAEDGDTAIELLTKSSTENPLGGPLRPALVLLDLNIPGFGGREVLRRIKSDETLRSTPMAVLTTSIHPSDVEACYRLGANCYHQKPNDLGQYERTIRQVTDYWLTSVVSPLVADELVLSHSGG